MATNWIQEKVWLSQEVRGDLELTKEPGSWREPQAVPLLIWTYLQVDKLRVMFLEMKNEKAKLMVKFQSHVRTPMPFQGHFPLLPASAPPSFPCPSSYAVLLSIGLNATYLLSRETSSRRIFGALTRN